MITNNRKLTEEEMLFVEQCYFLGYPEEFIAMVLGVDKRKVSKCVYEGSWISLKRLYDRDKVAKLALKKGFINRFQFEAMMNMDIGE